MSAVYKHNPDIVWRDEPEQRDEILAAFERGDDASEMGWVIIVDGGEINQLNLLAGDLWMLCDGSRDEVSMAKEIAEVYDGDPAEILEDVREFLAQCIEKGWLVREEV